MERVPDLAHLRHIVADLEQLRRRVTAGQHQLHGARLVLHQADQFFQRYLPVLDHMGDLVQNHQVVLAAGHQLPGNLPATGDCLAARFHLTFFLFRGEARGPELHDGQRTIQLLGKDDLSGLTRRALEKLDDRHLAVPAERPQRQPQCRRGLTLAVAGVKMHESLPARLLPEHARQAIVVLKIPGRPPPGAATAVSLAAHRPLPFPAVHRFLLLLTSHPSLPRL